MRRFLWRKTRTNAGSHALAIVAAEHRDCIYLDAAGQAAGPSATHQSPDLYCASAARAAINSTCTSGPWPAPSSHYQVMVVRSLVACRPAHLGGKVQPRISGSARC